MELADILETGCGYTNSLSETRFPDQLFNFAEDPKLIILYKFKSVYIIYYHLKKAISGSRITRRLQIMIYSCSENSVPFLNLITSR